MPIAPSFDELEQIGQAEQLINRPDLQFNEGDITEMLIKAAAAMADKNIDFAAQAFKETYVDGAEGTALTLLANDHWSIVRFDANAATGSVTFNRATAAAGAGTIAAGTTLSTVVDADGNQYFYTTDSAVSYGAAETGDKTVTVTASATGRGSNVAAGKISKIVTSLFDSSITVNNPQAMAGGSEEETDEALRVRIRSFFATLRRGTKEAIEFGAKQVPGVSVAYAAEDEGFVLLYVADADGNSNAEMISDVEIEIESWRAYGIPVSVVGGEPVSQDVDYTIAVKTGTDASAFEDLIEQAITAAINKLTLGETLYQARLIQAILSVDIDNIVNVVINDPSASVTPQPYQLIRTGTVTRT